MWLLYIVLGVPFLYALYNRYLHPLRNVPGPFWASVSPWWLAWNCYKCRRPRLDIELHKRYGSVVRIKPDEILFSNSEYFKPVYGAGSRFTKSLYYEAFADPSMKDGWDRLDMLTESNLDKLRIQRRFAGPIYAVANAKRHEDAMDNNTERWFKRLRSLSGKPLDFYREVERFHEDTMTEVTFGEAFGAVERGNDGGHMEHFGVMWRWWSSIGHLTWLNRLDKALAYGDWQKIFMNAEAGNQFPVFKFAVGKIEAFLGKAARSKHQPPSSPYNDQMRKQADHIGLSDSNEGGISCLFGDLMRLNQSKPEFLPTWATGLAMTDEGAGIDTLSWTISTVISAIATNPDVYQKVQDELREAVTASEMVPGEAVTYDAAAKLEYLDACIHEAQRIWPNIAQSLGRVVPPEGIEIDGYHVKGGMVVGMNSRVLGQSETIFGPEPDKFKPERWLDISKERRTEMEWKNLAFGGPSRKCPGMHMAWVVMSKTLAGFFLEFDVKILNELDGPPGPGGRVWQELGTFPTAWHGLEVEVNPRH